MEPAERFHPEGIHRLSRLGSSDAWICLRILPTRFDGQTSYPLHLPPLRPPIGRMHLAQEY